MATLIDYPVGVVQPDALPLPGDRYQAYGLAYAIKPETVWFVLSDGSMTGFPYTRLSRFSFFPLDDGKRDGECVMSLVFDRKPPGLGEVVTVTGRDLFRCYFSLGQHLAGWLWEASASQAEGDGPRVHAIEIKETTPDAMRALLSRRNGAA